MTRWGEFDDLRIDELEEAGPTKPENPIKGSFSFTFATIDTVEIFKKSLLKSYLP